MKHCKLVEILSNLNVKTPCTNLKPPHKRKAPQMTTFWRRFYSAPLRTPWLRAWAWHSEGSRFRRTTKVKWEQSNLLVKHFTTGNPFRVKYAFSILQL